MVYFELSMEERSFSGHWKWIFVPPLLLFCLILGYFFVQLGRYFWAIRSGEVNPLLQQKLEATVSRQLANSSVTQEDLTRLQRATAPSYGNKEGKVVMVEFVDFECPYCHQSFASVKQIMEEYKDRVYFISRQFPIEELHPDTSLLSQAALCAHEQGQYWAYHDKLFGAPTTPTRGDLMSFAKGLKLDEQRFTECLDSARIKEVVAGEVADGLRVGVAATPTFFFNGVRVQGSMNAEQLRLVLNSLLKQGEPTDL